MTERDWVRIVLHRYATHPDFLGLDITDVNQPGTVGDTLLHLAARIGVVEDIEVLVSAGAHINALEDLGYTPLHVAVLGGNLSSVLKMLELGADPSLKNEFGETAEMVARQLGHREITDVFVLRRPDDVVAG